MDLLGSVNSTISILGCLKSASKNIEDAQFKSLLADLSLEISELKLQLSGILEENMILKEENQKLRSTSEQSFTFDSSIGAYYAIGGDGPYCSSCYDNNGKAIRLVRARGPAAMHLHKKYKCGVCNSYI